MKTEAPRRDILSTSFKCSFNRRWKALALLAELMVPINTLLEIIAMWPLPQLRSVAIIASKMYSWSLKPLDLMHGVDISGLIL